MNDDHDKRQRIPLIPGFHSKEERERYEHTSARTRGASSRACPVCPSGIGEACAVEIEDAGTAKCISFDGILFHVERIEQMDPALLEPRGQATHAIDHACPVCSAWAWCSCIVPDPTAPGLVNLGGRLYHAARAELAGMTQPPHPLAASSTDRIVELHRHLQSSAIAWALADKLADDKADQLAAVDEAIRLAGANAPESATRHRARALMELEVAGAIEQEADEKMRAAAKALVREIRR